MTDDKMDARLRRAGQTWRDANAELPRVSPAPVDTIGAVPPAPDHRARRTGLFVSAAVVAAALVVGGTFLLRGGGGDKAPSTDGAAPALQGTVWRLTGYGHDQPRTDSLATLHIGAAGQLVADDGCNLIGAKIDVEDGHLAATHLDVRALGCTDSVGEVTFTRGLDILTSSPAYSLDGHQLTIGSMHLLAAPGLLPPTLDVPTFVGSAWALTRVTDGSGADHPVVGAPTFTIADGRLTVSDGCNTLSGDAAVDGQQVELKQLAQTEIGCTGPAAATAAAIDAVFAGTSVHEQVEGTRLVLKGNGVGELVYRWVPADKSATDPAHLVGPTWHLASVAGDPAAADATLRIDGAGRLQLAGACGEVTGTAVVEPGMLTTTGVPDGPPATCAGPAADQTSTAYSFLGTQPVVWAIRDGKLVIYGGGAQAFALVYDRDAPSAPVASGAAALHHTSWRLTGVAAGTERPSLTPGTAALRLTFDDDGTPIAYDDGVNSHSGDARIGDGTLDIGELATSAVGCARGCAQAELIGRVLSGHVSWSIAGDQLTITKAGVGSTTYERTGSPLSSAPTSSSSNAPAAGLVGPRWTLSGTEVRTGSGSDGTSSGSSASSTFVLTFDGAGGYRMAERCHDERGAAQLDATTVRFSGRSVTNNHKCPADLDPAAAQRDLGLVDGVLDGTATWSIDGAQLKLTRGATTLTFDR